MLPIRINLSKDFFNEEERCNYLITAQTKRLWAVLLDLLCEFDRVCKKNRIKYSLDSGTLLGAIRHKGFIPWDNDIDVIMLRSEYEKLCKIAPNEFTHPYFWQTNDTDPGSARRHAQLRNSSTTDILKDEMKDGHPLCYFNQGVFMDIFILDEIPDDSNLQKKLCQDLAFHISILCELKHLLYTNNSAPWICEALTHECRRYDFIASQYKGKGFHRVANITLIPIRKDSTLFPKELFRDLTECEFEGFRFPCPKDSETILTGYYGNWHEFVVNGGDHGDLFVDIEKPYTEYITSESQHIHTCPKNEIHPLALIFQQRNMAWKECDAIRKDNQVLEAKCKDSQKEIEQLQNKINHIKEDLEKTSGILDDYMEKYQKAKIEKKSIMDSIYWKITKPIRFICRAKF